MTLPYALGCPSCPYFIEVSDVDPDASLSDMHSHLRWRHPSDGTPNQLLAKVQELTPAEAAAR